MNKEVLNAVNYRTRYNIQLATSTSTNPLLGKGRTLFLTEITQFAEFIKAGVRPLLALPVSRYQVIPAGELP